MVFELRPYQKQLKKEVSTAFDTSKKVILCSPTGSGKTVTFADIARTSIKNGARVMVAVDRAELLKQARAKLIDYGLSPSIITAGKSVRHGQSCYVATVQTLTRRVFPEINLLIIDEAHKQIFDKLIMKGGGYEHVYTIGATATPKRSGRMRQLSSIYGHIIETTDINDLISQGFLSPAITYGAKVDKSKLKIKRGEYDNKELFGMFDKRTTYAGVVDKYRKFSDNTKAICFCINVEHSKKVAHAFNEFGISAVHLDGTMAKMQRESILESFNKGYFKVLCNVEICTTGYDEPSIETVIVNLATKSLPKWLQMCGRGSRIYNNKSHFNIIDMGGNVFEHGFWEQSREWSLTHKTRESLGVAPVKECPEEKLDNHNMHGCGALVPAPATTCKYCGYIFPEPKKKPLKEAEFIQLENYELLPEHLVGRSWGSMSITDLEEVRRVKGYKQGWIVRQILLNKDLELIDYAKFKQYKYPQAWVDRMEKMYIKK